MCGLNALQVPFKHDTPSSKEENLLWGQFCSDDDDPDYDSDYSDDDDPDYDSDYSDSDALYSQPSDNTNDEAHSNQTDSIITSSNGNKGLQPE